MIRALIIKDLRLVGRDRVFRFVLVGYLLGFLAGSLTFFSGFFSGNGSQFSAVSELLFSRVCALQWVLLAGISPWLILRMHGEELGHATMMAKPWQVLVSKIVASTMYLVVFLSLSLPVFSLLRLVGAAGLRQIAWALADVFLFLVVLILLVFHVRLRCAGWAASWTLSYVALAALGFGCYEVWSALDHASVTLTLLLMASFFAALLILHGNRTLIYERN